MTVGTKAGIDVSRTVLDVAIRRDGGALEIAQFDNNASGHRKLVAWLTKGKRRARVALESTGTYSLDVALALHRTTGIEVMVANPRAVKQFAGALMQRAKTDVTAALALQEFVVRMPFVAWVPPAASVLCLRGISRRIAALVVERARERNRLHALRATAEPATVVKNDVEVNIRHLGRRIELLTAEAVTLIAGDATLRRAYDQLRSVRGFAESSAVQLLPELLALPTDMTVRQWVAHAGLDPRPWRSGSSVDKPTHISKVGNAHIRRALFMPALVAVRHQPQVKAFFDQLVARGKRPLQAYVAVMRKLLHAIYGMFKTDTVFTGERFYATA